MSGQGYITGSQEFGYAAYAIGGRLIGEFPTYRQAREARDADAKQGDSGKFIATTEDLAQAQIGAIRVYSDLLQQEQWHVKIRLPGRDFMFVQAYLTEDEAKQAMYAHRDVLGALVLASAEGGRKATGDHLS